MTAIKEVGLVWMSAGNPYFTEENIAKTLHFALKRFAKVIILSPDEPAEHTFKALGYQDKEAKRKARLNANLLKNRAKRVIAALAPESQKKTSLIEWAEDITSNALYRKKYKELGELYHTNVLFKKDAQETTKKVIAKKEEAVAAHAIDEAVQYLLKELAFVVASPQIYAAQKVVYLYHVDWPIYQKFIDGKYDGVPKTSLGFLLTEAK